MCKKNHAELSKYVVGRIKNPTHIVDRSVDDDIAEPVVTVPLWLLDAGVAFVFALAAVFDVGPTPVIKRWNISTF